jgi:cleavage and polyadenylation specificity factor subunit 2
MGRVVCLTEAEGWRSEVKVGSAEEEGSGEVKQEDGDDTMGDVQKVEKGKKPLRGPFVPTVEEVHEAFDWIKPVRYHQPLHLGGELLRPL